MKDINDGIFNAEKIDRIKKNKDKIKKDYFLSKGDILFVSRGFNHYATLLDVSLENTIAISHFYVLKLKLEKAKVILPAYLAWYMNQFPAQKHYRKYGAGTGILLVNKEALEDLSVVIPDMNTQEKIVKLYKLKLKEKNLVNKIEEKKDRLIKRLLIEKISKFK